MPGENIKILTVNTHKGFAWLQRKFILHELRDALRVVNADLVFLQEVLGEHRQYANKYTAVWPQKSQYEFLADEIWPAHAYGRNAVYPEGHHGNALLSRFPIDCWHNFDISLNGIERRGLLYCHINLGKRHLHTICVHLSLRESHRQQQLIKLCEMIERLPGDDPLVVAGDFNDWRGKAHDVLLEQCQLRDVFHKHFGKSLRTFPAALPILRLDRIYVRDSTPSIIHRVPHHPWARLSDHKPLMVELTF